MKILHFGDIHVWRWHPALDLHYPKRALGLVNLGLRRRFHFPPGYARRIAGEIARQEADLVVFSGDMTTMSLESEFAAAAALFEPIHAKWGERFFCIPGNHDRYTPRSVRLGLYERFFPYGAFEEGKKVRVVHDAAGFSMVGFDCSHPCRIRSNGTMTEALEEELEEALRDCRDRGSPVMLVGHYPFAYPPEVEIAWQHKLLAAERLRRLVAEYKPVAYFHGHKHIRWILRDREMPETLCVNCGAAGMRSENETKQAGFVTLDLDEATGFAPVAARAFFLRGEDLQSREMALPSEDRGAGKRVRAH